MEKPAWQVREEQQLIAKFATDATVDATGVVRWNSNGQVPPSDVLRVWQEAGLSFNAGLSRSARARDVSAFVADYRAAQARRTPEQVAEQRAEVRAELGAGVELVNVITGERYRT